MEFPSRELKGQYIEFIDKDLKFRIGKVRKVSGNFITVGKRGERGTRVHRDRIKFRVTPKTKQEIDWNN